MSTKEISPAMYPRNKPPTIVYYGSGSGYCWKKASGSNLGGPPLLTDVILHEFIPLNLAPIHPAPSVHNLGLFGTLPDELLYLHILETLDLLSLVRFRNTSRHAHYLVDNIPEFKILVKWAPQVIRGVLAVQTNVVASMVNIVDKLRQRQCDRCDKPAQHIWLPTLDRLCFSCAHRGPMPLEEEEMLKHYGLTKNDLHLIPSFRFLPVTLQGPRFIEFPPPTERRLPESYPPRVKGAPYKPPDFDPSIKRQKPHWNSFRVPQQHILYDTQVAAQLALERTGQEIPPPPVIEDKEVQRIVDDSGKRLECIDLPAQLVPRRCRRAMGLVFAPWVNADGAESGVFCHDCLYVTGKDRNHDRGVHGSRDRCKSCRSLRYEDWYERKHCFYSLTLPSGSDVHFPYSEAKMLRSVKLFLYS
ncbi:hypothetical protein IQ07DRAFT_628835 [Pyrenochaeta sp. DS3sAY3a]|nr:hypothetical protein IQ07DRAFT_628835 [Pyrenochaeta sp. DS3sAY3a]